MKKNKGHRHIRKLVPSSTYVRWICAAVHDRFVDVTRKYHRAKGEMLLPPKRLELDIYRWREMFVRFDQGDFRHRESEWKSLKVIAQWTLDEKQRLVDKPLIVIDWDADERLHSLKLPSEMAQEN